MVNFTTEQLRRVMNKRRNIRNMSVIAHVDHGKSTLTDSLVAKAGLMSNKDAGNKRMTDDRQDEQERCITIKSTGISLYYTLSEDEIPQDSEGNGFLINLIDSPGHIDFSAEVTAALRVTDGALVVVDCVEGVCVQTETVLRQALSERIKPVVILNKIDRCLLELNADPEDIYQKFSHTIDNVNVIISTYTTEDGPMGNLLVSPSKGTVCFGSGLHAFGFTLTKFAKMYAVKYGVPAKKLMPQLWGEKFWNPTSKKFFNSSKTEKGEILERSFCSFVLKPIVNLSRAIMENNKEKYILMLKKLGMKLEEDEMHKEGRALISSIFRRWLPAAEALLEMIILHLPSPVEAQKYRMETLYTGPVDDECAKAIQNCDPNGPLMLYISKMIPATDKGRFYAFGRVFSGTVSQGQQVRIMGSNYVPGSKEDLHITNIQRTVLMMGRKIETLQDCPCGNTISIVGIDQYLVKSGTLSSSKDAYPLKAMKFSVSPVVRVAVQPKNSSDLQKLVDGLNRLSKSDPCVVVSQEETGEHIVSGAGELHLEICLKDLEEDFACCPIVKSAPVVSYRETVQNLSSIICMSKSANKLNRVMAQALPLEEELISSIESGEMNPRIDSKTRGKILQQKYGWDQTDSKRVWSFGPDSTGPNLLVDVTKSSEYLQESKENFIAAFQWATKLGVLCEEPLRGVRFNIVDVHLHSDASHRGGGQLVPCGRRVLYAAQYTANPSLFEPVYLCEITAPISVCGAAHALISKRRGRAFDQQQRDGTPLVVIKAYLPVSESFGFDGELREATSGQAFPQMIFDHWEVMQGNPLEEGNLSKIIKSIRKRKGIDENNPPLDRYNDKL
ncbi:Elongation factor 2 [Tritrichomonas foetus]|uniref:Elongation factor 2 n=1 Tax=Tritrichomonas foetus TaxID=1144522 RepID=A0A1J4KIK5_9EUKA|nr:Elongation factor 2 [Tritrichomonas foetus]|eukprot:OHT09141.1 Elongation factor 2 [Tritrichomonas foetus]